MRIFVVIPAYKCKAQVLSVISKIPEMVEKVIVVDDACPQKTGQFVLESVTDPRLTALFHDINQGVGGAVMTGYKAAVEMDADIIVKIDGDGQMNPELIPQFVRPIEMGFADYTKGNRFTQVEHIRQMPVVRLIGNLGLSFINKAASGYWKVLDPTNGYTAIHRSALKYLPFNKIHQRYFFESDMLFRLNLVNALVLDVPMESVYADEVSNLRIGKSFFEFLKEHSRNFFKRIIYQYYLLDFNMASVQLVLGLILFLFGFCFGAFHWARASTIGSPTPTGTIMISVVTILAGIQFLTSFIGFDISKEARVPLSRLRSED